MTQNYNIFKIYTQIKRKEGRSTEQVFTKQTAFTKEKGKTATSDNFKVGEVNEMQFFTLPLRDLSNVIT